MSKLTNRMSKLTNRMSNKYFQQKSLRFQKKKANELLKTMCLMIVKLLE